MRRLHLLSGSEPLPGHVTLDGSPTYKPDYLALIPPLPAAVIQESWDEVALIHGIEHFHLWQAEDLLREIRSILKPGGRLILEQPNLLFVARVLCGLEKPLISVPGQCDIWAIYGDPREVEHSPLMLHRWGWTPETLGKALKEAGFGEVIETRAQFHLPGRDFRMEAVKL
jgi:SAM-dependent methyltransferase